MATLSHPTDQTASLEAIAYHLALIRERVTAAAARSGRDATAVTVIAVSKTVPLDRLRGLDGADITDLGENRVQEAAPKVEALGRSVVWHLIGHVQRNKARAAVALFDLIHSVDSLELAVALDRHAGVLGKQQRVLFQVNVSGEASKSGFTQTGLRAQAGDLAALAHLRPEGLMTIAPLGARERELRTDFAALHMLRDDLAPVFSGSGGFWRHLSMGMSDDYEIAVEEGATLVRVGRAIFGERPRPADSLSGI